jgi:hypothetical protein
MVRVYDDFASEVEVVVEVLTRKVAIGPTHRQVFDVGLIGSHEFGVDSIGVLEHRLMTGLWQPNEGQQTDNHNEVVLEGGSTQLAAEICLVELKPVQFNQLIDPEAFD